MVSMSMARLCQENHLGKLTVKLPKPTVNPPNKQLGDVLVYPVALIVSTDPKISTGQHRIKVFVTVTPCDLLIGMNKLQSFD